MSTKVISYFSYKGGAGRSTLAYNTIPLLARNHFRPTRENPIIVVDMDIDSCGMSYLLDVANEEIKEDACVQYVLREGCDPGRTASIRDHATLKKLIAVGEKFGYADNEAILFLPAKDIKNVDTAGNFNYGDANSPFLSSLQSFIDVCETYNVPAVIFDSAVGNQATANVANQLANVIVCCMRPTTQFVDGTARYLESLDSDSGSPLGGGRKKIVLVPNVVPQEHVVIDNHNYPDMAIKRIRIRLNDIISDRDEDDDITYNTDMLDINEFGIPAVKSFMWREGQLATQAELNENEQLVLQRYEKLAAIIDRL